LGDTGSILAARAGTLIPSQEIHAVSLPLPDAAASPALTLEPRWPLTMSARLAWTIAFAFLLTRLLSPVFLDNEMAYSLGAIMVGRPGLLEAQAYLVEMSRISIVYNYLTAPIFLAFGAFWGTVILRVLLAAFQLWALSRMTRALGLAPWALVVLLLVWLNAEQTLAAGENIVGGASTKQIAYGFVFLAIESLVRQDWRRLPIWCGLATAFHVLVGGWTTLAIGLTILVAERDSLGWKGMVRFGFVAGVLALPSVLPALLSLRPEGTALAGDVNRTYVAFANPFHQDPGYFLSPGEAIKVLIVSLLGILLIRRLAPAPGSRLVPLFLAALGLFFFLGVAAGPLEMYGFLKYYPFRVGDAVLPLACWIGLVLVFQRWYSARPHPVRFLVIPIAIGLANWLIDRAEPRPAFPGARGFAEVMIRTEPRLTAYYVREQARAWAARARGERSDLARLEDWARESTDPGAVFITPPWELTWPINAERATWVSFKILTAGPSVLEWRARLEALHGRPFEGVGFEILKELRQTYPAMTAEHALRLADRWRADYLVALGEVPGLALVHREGPYRVYRLQEGI
jgi:hypothetical protein